jgi:hypothetical protein
MVVLICGDRNWADPDLILETVRARLTPADTIIHGACRGADTFGGQAGLALGLSVRSFPADWTKYGRAAGPIRNQQMLDQHPDEVWAFHDSLSSSKGTKDMMDRAHRAGVVVKHFCHK